MGARSTASSRAPDWYLILVLFLALLVCLLYTCAGTYLAPYPGFSYVVLGSSWAVQALEPCEASAVWCDANRNTLQVGDQLLVIGGLTRADWERDRRHVPFDGYGAGESVPITLRRDGEEQTVHWRMLGPTISSRLERLVRSLLMFGPFWLAGTIVLLFLQPRDRRWRLLTVFNYATAVWVAAGVQSPQGVAYASLVQHALAWLLVPIYHHFHLVVPSPLSQRDARRFLFPLYITAVILALLEFLQALPRNAFNLALLLAFLGSLGPVVFRLLAPRPASDRLAARLMLLGGGMAGAPAIVLWVVPMLLGVSLLTGLAQYVAMFAFPLLPFFYIYAIYKHRLGALEFRANRLLSLYSFTLLYATALVLVLFIGSQWLGLSGSSVIFDLAVSTVFVVAALPLRSRFQRLIDRLAYGTPHSPDTIIRVFASRIPAALNLGVLAQLLTGEVAPSLLIRQSALLLPGDGPGPRLLYARGVDPGATPETPQQVQQLLAQAGRYRPPGDEPQDRFDWVRLALPLQARDRTVGVWLFGRRDPDDYYPQSDVQLLTTLAGQVAVAIENAFLYDQAQQEIQERTRAEEALRASEAELRALAVRLAEVEETERQRLARELHDQVGQNLTALGINLNIVRAQVPEDAGGPIRARLDDSLALVEETTERVRGVMADLRPPVLDDYGLMTALRWYGAQFSTRTGISVDVQGEEPAPPLATSVENALFRIAQEALTNVAKHALATRVVVTIAADESALRLVIADDGVGFDSSVPGARRGWGLLTMAERAEAIGGSCRVESRPQAGTRVIVEVAR